MPNCDVSLSYLGVPVDQNEKVNISSYHDIKTNFSPIRKGNPCFEAKAYEGTKSFAIGFLIGKDQILLYSTSDGNYCVYDFGWKFTGFHSTNYTKYTFPLKHSFPIKETVGVGLCIENKTFVIFNNETYETVKIDFPDDSLVTPIVRQTSSDNNWDVISVNFGTKYPFEYHFPGFSPFCLAEHLCKPSYL
ncbi:hypothetical protein TVAG_249570 [Trichomonas vaginalis G3]|uniref:B30.2/SPRY domain-containing protein n=1 Tax=Trichomonas vaginalis (strain ATCC PRA-98 / G3) TaxID=412133 RepID=A2DCG0_TRIV3|nr:hypothetical protein TVAGG3_0956950 [Trichomonas vaginalis G3]EAY21897.1 hypothetical protein TVAG_249570 [Trichomonas vaginalis G3]KAI5487627.1 hypothetical protein TVAGG3_0956950 [Trichomonas vaginalis G3]|eukprot:XP_001582883.1 hypothetical protein [Trichomonas vaginalis G3]